jgi:hypothetical protein
MSISDISIDSSLQQLEPGMWIFRYVGHTGASIPPLVNLNPAPFGKGVIDFFPSEGVSRNTLVKPGDCIIARVKTAKAAVMISEYHPAGQHAKVTLKLDRIGAVVGNPLTEAASEEQGPAKVERSKGKKDTHDSQSVTDAALDSLNIKLLGHIQMQGDVVVQNDWLGNPAGIHRIEGFALSCDELPEGVSLGYSCRTTRGSQPQVVLANQFVGTRRKATPITAVAFNLGGPNAKEYVLSGEVAFAGLPPLAIKPGKELAGPTGSEQLVALRIAISKKASQVNTASPWDDPAITKIFKSR